MSFGGRPDGGHYSAPAGPSRVLHCSNLPPGASHIDLAAALSPFGRAIYAMTLPNRSQYLIEMSTQEEANHIIHSSAASPILIHGRPIRVQYSKSQEITRTSAIPLDPYAAASGGMRGPAPPSGGSGRVLLINVQNVLYPITVDVMEKILRPFGDLLRVVIFEKDRGLQALAEFRAPHEAEAAMAALQGREIYDKCCKLFIQVSKNDAVNVRENSERQRDFTNPHLPGRSMPGFMQPQYGAAPYMTAPTPGYGMPYPAMAQQAPPRGGPHDRYPMPASHGYGGYDAPAPFPSGGRFREDFDRRPPHLSAPSGGDRSYSGMPGPAGGDRGFPGMSGPGGGGRGFPGMAPPRNDFDQRGPGPAGTPVIMVYNRPSTDVWSGFSHEHMYNIFSCFGDVLRVRLMSKPENSAMVEFATPRMAMLAMDALQRAPLKGKQLHITQSKHTSLLSNAAPGSATAAAMAVEVKDFCESLHHRFKRGLPSKLPNPPCSTIYFTNASPDVTEEKILALLTSSGAAPPKTVRFLPPPPDKEGSNGQAPRKAGFIDFPTVEDAIEAIMLCNNLNVDGSYFRLSFASRPTRIRKEGEGGPKAESTAELTVAEDGAPTDEGAADIGEPVPAEGEAVAADVTEPATVDAPQPGSVSEPAPDISAPETDEVAVPETQPAE